MTTVTLVAYTEKNLPTMQETWVRFLGQENPLEKDMATHSSILAWKNPMDRGAWQANGPWGHKELDTTEQLTVSLCSVLSNHENVCQTRNKNRGKYGRSLVTYKGRCNVLKV